MKKKIKKKTNEQKSVKYKTKLQIKLTKLSLPHQPSIVSIQLYNPASSGIWEQKLKGSLSLCTRENLELVLSTNRCKYPNGSHFNYKLLWYKIQHHRASGLAIYNVFSLQCIVRHIKIIDYLVNGKIIIDRVVHLTFSYWVCHPG